MIGNTIRRIHRRVDSSLRGSRIAVFDEYGPLAKSIADELNTRGYRADAFPYPVNEMDGKAFEAADLNNYDVIIVSFDSLTRLEGLRRVRNQLDGKIPAVVGHSTERFGIKSGYNGDQIDQAVAQFNADVGELCVFYKPKTTGDIEKVVNEAARLGRSSLLRKAEGSRYYPLLNALADRISDPLEKVVDLQPTIR